MSYDDALMERYRGFVIDRHQVWEKRQADEPGPWANDPIVASRKFTNCFRVLDYGSQYLLRNLLDSEPEDILARCTFYRLTNSPYTWNDLWAWLGGGRPTAEDFTHRPETIYDGLDRRRKTGAPVFSGAYIIMPTPGVKGADKVRGVIDVTRAVVENAPAFFAARSQEERFAVLRSTPGIGRFLAMQILTDWGYAQEVNRENEFVVAGPGARRGAASLNPDLPAEKVIEELTAEWDNDPDVRLNGHPLGLMNVQNTLCEFSKYVRYMGQGHRAAYVPVHPGPHEITLPAWLQ